MKDMQAYFAEDDRHKRDEIALRGLVSLAGRNGFGPALTQPVQASGPPT
jgi:hypothetical protein